MDKSTDVSPDVGAEFGLNTNQTVTPALQDSLTNSESTKKDEDSIIQKKLQDSLNLNQVLQRMLRKQRQASVKSAENNSTDVVNGESNSKIMRMSTTGTPPTYSEAESDQPIIQPILEEWLEVEEELEEAQRNLQQAREERKAAQREREAARKERLEAQKDRETAQAERRKAQFERIQAQKERLAAKKERDECRAKRIESQKKRQEARRERIQAEIEYKEAQIERRNANGIEMEEAEKEFLEINAELEEAQREREEKEKEVNSALKEQMEQRLEEREQLLEMESIMPQNIKVEEFILESHSSEDADENDMSQFSSSAVQIQMQGLSSNETCEGRSRLYDDDQFFLFKCPDCGNGYNKRSSFMRHAKTHSGAEHECYLCKKMFGRSDVLKRHIKNMHGIMD